MAEFSDGLAKLRRQRLIGRLHEVGPRALVELFEELFELVPPLFHAEIDTRLQRYAALDVGLLKTIGGYEIPRVPLHVVRRGGGRR
jgi:hypothetical protein